ncbi:conserved hypothetical protein [Rhodopseudomonas palustris HaA2]|uniref:Uncharacterized protein n=1 Tax=Rhodopseudomonas palustris (strain HaA2) TaxID=316058 RepID=Q2IVV5_RHOP2|nr:hypothetical protein [Rhodopseudomonas palustris]ABD07655.1 conserved hypothetical protein [Rhodopseudomonas palustris HaA2]
MRKLIIAATALTLASGGLALAQSGGSGSGGMSGGAGSGARSGGAGGVGGPANPSVPPALTKDQGVTGQAPVGHRQPRRTDVPPERSIDQVDPADAALDRKIKSICRGC